MDIQKIFIDNMRRLRKQAGLSQEKIAVLCDTNPTYIRQIETGRKCPSLIFIGKIANALLSPPQNLFYYEPSLEDKIMLDEYSKRKQHIKNNLIERVSKEISSAFDGIS